MSSFEFVDNLPEARRAGRGGSRILIEFAAALRANPGKWGKYPRELSLGSARGLNSHIQRGNSAAFRGGRYEATARGDVAYVRFLGGAE